MTNLLNPIFTDADKAREALEAVRWPNGPVCPHCGGTERIGAVQGKSHRAGLYYCGDCKGQFTVTVGTVFARSKIALNKWWLACHLMGSSKKGFSAHQLHRSMGVTYKTAWFMAHRIREAMRELHPEPVGGGGGIVEADETYVGGKEKNKHRSKRDKKHIGGVGKEAVFSLVERDGKVRSSHVTSVSAKNLGAILAEQLADASKTTLMTDGEGQYRILAPMFKAHEVVNHSIGEYVRGNVHTNTIEGYFSILKRGITGTYHHVSPQHLKRYLAEFDLRYNERAGRGVSDKERTAKIMKGIEGKRLTYRQPRIDS